MDKITVEKREHNGFKEFRNFSKRKLKLQKGHATYTMKQYFGRFQYILSSKKGKISLVRLLDINDCKFYEIYCFEGNLFEDTMRFDTYREALKKCKELLQ